MRAAASLVALVLSLVIVAPQRVHVWGFDPHRYIVDRAIGLLPAALKPFYAKHRAFIIEHAIDPDLWRTAGWEEEPPRHFLDMDAFGNDPRNDLPRDFDAAVAKFGRDTIMKNGVLPWRAQEIFTKLIEAFQSWTKGEPWAADNVKFFSAVLAHYISDAHVPFHAVVNYDGQLTNQHGIHARFETELFQRYRDRLTIQPPPLVEAPNVRDFVFDVLLSSMTMVEGVLQADLIAAKHAGEFYDDVYFKEFFTRVQPTLERRLSQSIAAVASVYVSAWRRGGSPDLMAAPARAPRRIRR
jgi:hypothetical protein